jgi:GT2 family glycosyltransferase
VSSLDFRVVIPSHERRGLVARLVRGLLDQTIPPESYEIVVVCDGCTDGTGDALRGAFGGRVTVIEQPQRGPGAARNRGTEGAATRWILFLDDDMRPSRDLIERHGRAQRRLGDGLVLGALPVDPDSPRSYLTEGLARWAGRRDARLREAGGTIPFDDVLTGNLSIDRGSLERLGGFDPEFFGAALFGDEDLELGWRAAQAGVPIAYAPDAIAWQTFDKSFRALARDIRSSAAADARFVSKHPDALPRLTLGRVSALPAWERRALRFAAGHPRAAAPWVGCLTAVLHVAARSGATGGRLEQAHAIARAAIYGLGLSDAGAAAFVVPESTA